MILKSPINYIFIRPTSSLRNFCQSRELLFSHTQLLFSAKREGFPISHSPIQKKARSTS